MLYRASSITSKFSDKMSTSVPVEVGTRGTVGSLLKKEIEYFRKVELDCSKGSSNNKSQKSTVEINSSGGGNSWPSFGFLTMKWKKKKRRGNGGVLPAMCSMVEVSESCKMNEIPGFSYRNLKVDSKRFEEEITLS